MFGRCWWQWGWKWTSEISTWNQVPEFNGAVDLSCRAPPGANLVCPCENIVIFQLLKISLVAYQCQNFPFDFGHLQTSSGGLLQRPNCQLFQKRPIWNTGLNLKEILQLYTGTLPSKPLILRGLCQSSSIDSVFTPANDGWVVVFLLYKIQVSIAHLSKKGSFECDLSFFLRQIESSWICRKTGLLGYFGSSSSIQWIEGEHRFTTFSLLPLYFSNPQILKIKGLNVWRLEVAGKNISATSHSPRNSLALGKQVILTMIILIPVWQPIMMIMFYHQGQIWLPSL